MLPRLKLGAALAGAPRVKLGATEVDANSEGAEDGAKVEPKENPVSAVVLVLAAGVACALNDVFCAGVAIPKFTEGVTDAEEPN